MAIPDEPPDDVDAGATPTVASANDTTDPTMTTGSMDTLAAATDGTANALIVSPADTTETAAITEGQAEAAGAISLHLHATSTLHGLNSEDYAIGVQQDLAFVENDDERTQQSYGEPRGSPVEEANASVAPTSVTAFRVPNRIRDVSSGVITRVDRTRFSSSSSLSSASEDDESEEGAIGGVTKKNCDRSLEKKSSKSTISSGDEGKSVDLSSVRCSICKDRFLDTVCLPCGHLGCYRCIERWLLSGRRCHMCRRYVIAVKTPVSFCNHSGEPCFTNKYNE